VISVFGQSGGLAIDEQIGDETLRAQYVEVAESYLKLAASELDRAAARRP
jgi:hypothetical protein